VPGYPTGRVGHGLWASRRLGAPRQRIKII